ncbi:carboxypeptidase-like regulatory domain-containing protein [Xanthomarina sp. F2636L]|uniref:carboxypeptidase-like regulatory domain-containing protein n=1 Tax=Xanthomarina sp. F2636L TaxID=2996018 RepID=UPI00225DEBC5|nr:carboxypeptidase-like regulatory domain-containing protein [Xanthomarina sp. F2636L]MCX7549434.1 carboxypeptidase-like regulatory domain-containing protein [Xanthomarina sp. F2636L]
MLKKSLSILFILGYIYSGFAQQVSGKVVTKTNEPIPFATIQIGPNYGVITNEEGSFSIDTEGFKASDSVHISCMGFEKIGFELQEFSSKTFKLDEQVNELYEVYLTNKPLTIDSIMYYVNRNLKSNYKNNLVTYDIFSRRTEYIIGKDADFEIDKSTGFKKKQLEAFNKDFDALERSLLNNKSKQYTEFVGKLNIKDVESSKLEVDKAIRLLDERNDQSVENLAEKGQELILKHLDKDKIYTVKSGWFKVSDSVSLDEEKNNKMEDTINSLKFIRNMVQKMVNDHGFSSKTILNFITDTRKYEYEIKDITFIGSEMVYVIEYAPRRGSADFEGTFYVSNETFAILRADYKFAKGRIGEKLNLKLLLGIKYIEQNKRGFVIYKKHKDGYYSPNYMTDQLDRYFYVDRPIKFKDNNSREKVSFDFKVEGIFKEKNEILVMGEKDITPSEFNATKEKRKIDYETLKAFNPNYWKDYNVLEPLKEMKEFKVVD